MSNPARFTRRTFLSWLLPASGAFLSSPLAAETLEAHLTEGKIHVAAPRLRFVTGKALERLRNGAPVPFAIQLALSTDRWLTNYQRDIERFVFSYDLWEERFTVSKLGSPRRVVSHLAAQQGEAWCISELAVPPAGLAGGQPFWLRLEIRAENPGEETGVLTDEGVSLTRLVELFSRRTRGREQNRWAVEAGPFRLAELAPASRPGASR